MSSFSNLSGEDQNLDFAALLEQSFEEIDTIDRGDILTGTILAIDEYGIIVDLGLKRDGVVPRADLDAIDDGTDYQVGQHVTVMVIRPEDRDGNLVVSIKQAVASKDWDAAQTMMENEGCYRGEVVAANKGGLIVPFGELRGFVPASHIINLPRGLNDEERIRHLRSFVGGELDLKIIEVNARRRRLVFSQRLALQDTRERAKDRLLATLKEGDVVSGRVSSLRDFGAFVDLGGADGLIHVSELAWHRVKHPGEVVRVGQEIETYVLQLDRREKRIGLSLKRLKTNPWVEIAEKYAVGQVVDGTISRVVSFGAFVELENGIEALLHVSEISDPPPRQVEDVFLPGDSVRARIINLEPQRQRMGLSIFDMPQSGTGDSLPGDQPPEAGGVQE
jgi:small subunit ribosomal protein S1